MKLDSSPQSGPNIPISFSEKGWGTHRSSDSSKFKMVDVIILVCHPLISDVTIVFYVKFITFPPVSV